MNPFHRPTASNRQSAATPIRRAKNLLLIGCGAILFSTSAFAAPVDEITRAATVNGVTDISQARPKQFVKVFTSVALRAQPRGLPAYVIAAINLRPDLAPNAVAVAVKAATKNWDGKPAALCLVIDRIVRAAIAADPDGAVSIAHAAASAAPLSRHCIISAAIAAAPQSKDQILEAATAKTVPWAFLTFSAADATAFSSWGANLNPANISQVGGNGAVISPEQPPSH